MDTRIVWFRRDLRVHDHEALRAALDDANGDTRLVALFVWDPAIVERGRVSVARLAYLCDALADLDHQLRDRGARLTVRAGAPVRTVTGVAAEVSATAVHWSRDYTPYARRRDRQVRDALAALDDPPVVVEHEGVVIHEPGTVLTNSGGAYKVFTPFHRRWLRRAIGDPLDAPTRIPGEDTVTGDDLPTLDRLSLQSAAGTDLDAAALLAGGETAALQRLQEFLGWRSQSTERFAEPGSAKLLRGGVDEYDTRRNMLAEDGTSRLSADLHFGCLSPRRVYTTLDRRNPGQRAFATELAWREFYLHVLAAWPEVLSTEFDERYRDLPWSTDDHEASAWRDGMTGYPVVDAGMRQLRRTGWMHNRARMIVASFLCKDLLIDWRIGERHFLEHLIDGDLASNNGGWQWAAGTGTDAQPYFRIFNPVTQGERFDPDGGYVRRWVPELAAVPTDYIHHPWDMPDDIAVGCGVTVGRDYPTPLVDHGESRQRALRWFDEHRRD